MTEFNEFKKKVCNFYRQNKMTYFIWVNPEWQKTSVEISFRMDNVSILFAYSLSSGYSNKTQRERKAEKMMNEISKDLKGIENEFCDFSVIDR